MIMDYEKIMNKARKTNRRRDAMDKRNGFAGPLDGDFISSLDNIMAAIECGIRTDDWNNVTEGQAMLEEFKKRIIEIEKRLDNE